MSDDLTFGGQDSKDTTDTTGKTVTDFTQVVSCAFGGEYEYHGERRRQSLRAKLEREEYERRMQEDDTFVTTLRNLFKYTG